MTVAAKAVNRPVEGILWMLVTGLLFVAVNAIVKHVGSTVPPAESAFLRYVLGLVFLVPMLGSLRRDWPRARDLRLFALRGAVHTVAVILWFYAMTQIALAEVAALNYLAPIYVTIGAALFLGERLALRRIVAVGAGLVGALIILRPGFREIGPGHVAMLGTAFCFGISYLLAKPLSARTPPAVVVAMLSITVTIGLAPFAAADWVTPGWDEVGWMFVVACFATAGHLTMTLAFRAAPVAVTQPVTFLQLVWAVLLGAAFFHEPPDPYVILGGLVIVGAVSFIAWREAVASRRPVTPPDAAVDL